MLFQQPSIGNKKGKHDETGLHLLPTEIQVLDQHQKELFYIFQLYAFLDMSTTEAMQKENTMNITEFQMPGFASFFVLFFCCFSVGSIEKHPHPHLGFMDASTSLIQKSHHR